MPVVALRNSATTAPLTASRAASLRPPKMPGRAFGSRAAESLFYGALVFSPVLCAGLLFSSSYKRSSSTAADFGANLLGAMIGGVCEYFSLLAGYRFLLIPIAGCYLAATWLWSRRG